MPSPLVGALLAAAVLCPACAHGPGSAHPSPSLPELREAEVQKRQIPEVVWNLFYAVKESIDPVVVVGPPASPAPALEDYSRVSTELLDRLGVSFSVESYTVNGSDYELIVRSRHDPESRFRATRELMYTWHNAHWEPVGGYLHI
jgi:hypothetical protein